MSNFGVQLLGRCVLCLGKRDVEKMAVCLSCQKTSKYFKKKKGTNK